VHCVYRTGEPLPAKGTQPKERERVIPIPTVFPPGTSMLIPREISSGKAIPANVVSRGLTVRVAQPGAKRR